MSDFLGYKGKRVVISGCYSGMGAAAAKMLVDLGAIVHGLDYKVPDAKFAAFTQTDLRDPASIDAAVSGIDAPIDALFNCAGLPQTAAPLDVMKVNFLGTRHLTERVLEKMREGGAVASISSTGGMGWSRRIPTLMQLVTTPNFEAGLKWCEANLETVAEGYSLSKEAVIVWTQFRAAQTIKKGIRINCTLPGPTQTPMMKEFQSATPAEVFKAVMQPIDRYSTPEEQAGPLVLLNSAVTTYLNGAVLPVDGGFMGGVATGQVDMSAMMRRPE
jgi:NAD(P)-dependent dehydrogenase (short-subunit alcohol dehydrogenase family)